MQKKIDLASLKSDADNLNIDELKAILTNLNNSESKVNKINVNKLKAVELSDLEQRCCQKTVHDQLVMKVNGIEDKITSETRFTSKF